jgi:protoheme IX farnesyltransferase
VLLWVLTILFAPVAGMGHLYTGAAIALGGVFTALAIQLIRKSTGQTAEKAAMRVFGWSITYITLLFGAMALDQLVRSGV